MILRMVTDHQPFATRVFHAMTRPGVSACRWRQRLEIRPRIAMRGRAPIHCDQSSSSQIRLC